jgi:hypothetical protein
MFNFVSHIRLQIKKKIQQEVSSWRRLYDVIYDILSGWVETNLPNIHIFNTDVR